MFIFAIDNNYFKSKLLVTCKKIIIYGIFNSKRDICTSDYLQKFRNQHRLSCGSEDEIVDMGKAYYFIKMIGQCAHISSKQFCLHIQDQRSQNPRTDKWEANELPLLREKKESIFFRDVTPRDYLCYVNSFTPLYIQAGLGVLNGL